jgi:hypothetical protein
MAIDLDAAIEDAEAQIAELDRQREAAVTRLAELTDLRQGRERSADSGGESSAIAKARGFADLRLDRRPVDDDGFGRAERPSAAKGCSSLAKAGAAIRHGRARWTYTRFGAPQSR